MKRKVVFSLFLLTSLFAKAELSLNVGTNSFAGGENLESATSLGIRGDFYLDGLYHIDVGYDDLGHVKRKNSSQSVKVSRLFAQFSADGEEEYHVVPSMSVGVGYEKQSGESSDSQPFISAGVNFRYNVTNSLNFLLGTKALWKTSGRDVNFHTTFGVGYLIGEEPVNNQEEIQRVEEIKIPDRKLDIKTQFSNQIVTNQPNSQNFSPIATSNQELPPPNELSLAQAPKETIVKNSYENGILPPPTTVEAPKYVPVKSDYNQNINSKNYFIQVAAYSKYQPTSLLTRLANLGNHIILRHQGSITKALVGPYSSEYQARAALRRIKPIARSAFIYKGN